eukprot:335148_1
MPRRGSWECSKCTLMNKSTANKCAACRNKYTKNDTSKRSMKDDLKLAKEWQRIYSQRDEQQRPQSLIPTSKLNKKKRRLDDIISDEEHEDNDIIINTSIRKKQKIYKVDQNSENISKQEKLKRLLIDGFKPRNWSIPMARVEMNSEKSDKTIRSRSIHRIYNICWNTNKTNKFIVQRKSQGKEYQIKSIDRFLRHNGLGSINGFVEYKTNKSRYYEWSKPPLKTIMLSNHRIDALNGQKGVIATKVIGENTCISQYSGVEYSADEWDKIYSGSNKFIKHRQYLCSSDINNYKITIDPMELSDKQYCIYINDYRQNIFQSTFVGTGDDEKYYNTDFCEVLVNGYPAIFLVTKRKIEINEELCCFYGADYGDILKDVAKNEDEKRYRKYQYKKIFDEKD